MTEAPTKVTSFLTLNTFRASPFRIESALEGARLEFQQDGEPTEVRLPGKDRVDERDPDTYEPADITTGGRDKSNATNAYEVHATYVITQPPETLVLPVDPEIRHKDVTSSDKIFPLLERAAHLADRAFERFGGVLRWKTRMFWAARPAMGLPTEWKGALFDRETRDRIIGMGNFEDKAFVAPPISQEQWLEIGKALQEGLSCPVHFELLYSGQWLLSHHEVRRAVIDLAVACEVYMKNTVLEALPSGTSEAVREYLARANVSTHYKQLFPAILPEGRENPTWAEIKGDLNDLFDARNALLHDGTHDHLKEADCQPFSQAARKLLAII